jgi:hypothetical protein
MVSHAECDEHRPLHRTVLLLAIIGRPLYVPAPTSWLTFLQLFADCFNSPSQLLSEQLVTAWALCPGRRTLTRLWSVIPSERRRSHGPTRAGPRRAMVAGRTLAPSRRPACGALGAGRPAGPAARAKVHPQFSH